MKYTVVSTPLADSQLADIWLQATDRQAVAKASDEIERRLAHDPEQQGRAHPGGWRVLPHPPLIVTFRVSKDDRLATILSVFYRP